VGKLVDKGTCMYPKWTLSSTFEILGVKLCVDPLTHNTSIYLIPVGSLHICLL